jgi:aspartate 1-decarboxylase
VAVRRRLPAPGARSTARIGRTGCVRSSFLEEIGVKKYISAKIHGLTVTRAALEYHGSVGVDRELLQAVGIEPYEAVLVVNLANGSRWETYALPAGPGEFHLNGGSARLGCVGDRCLVITFTWADRFDGARVLMMGADNKVAEVVEYSH